MAQAIKPVVLLLIQLALCELTSVVAQFNITDILVILKDARRRNVKKQMVQMDWPKPTSSDFWVRRLHTLVLTGNGAALVLLSNMVSKSATPIESLQASRGYFVLFAIGLLFAGLASIVGIGLATMEKVIPEIVDRLKLEQELKNVKGMKMQDLKCIRCHHQNLYPTFY